RPLVRITLCGLTNCTFCNLPSLRATPHHVLQFLLPSTATSYLFALSLLDALPISHRDPLTSSAAGPPLRFSQIRWQSYRPMIIEDRKSTRLNSSHVSISYAVSCSKKKNFVLHADAPTHICYVGPRRSTQPLMESLT